MAATGFNSLVGGRYEIGERLGVGGMSEVYAATDTRLGRQVAVKFLKSEVDDPTARARIEGEARAAAALSHPNVVSVYDAGDHEERPYVVMELADARSLADVIREEGGLPPDRVRSIASQVLAALAAAHARGLVHRDVKPANILVGEQSVVKLADFGIAKSFADAASSMTAVGLVMGTPTYLSPEQAAGQPATPQSDLYAMGVVLFEALTGRPPFTGDTPVAVVAAHAHAPVPDIRETAPAVPASLARVVERALAKDPADRFADADHMARALEGAGASEPTRAVEVANTAALPLPPPTSTASAERAWAPAVMGGVAVLVFVLLLFFGLRGGGGELEPSGAADPTGLPAGAVAPPTETREEPTTTSTQAPRTMAELIGLLQDDPDAAGAKGPELLEGLQEVMGAEDPKRAQLARSLQNRISGWADDGELEPAIASTAVALLDPLTGPAGPGRRGNGDRDEDDDDD